MSLRTNKDNIYLVVPPQNDDTSGINKFMEGDFTIFARVKIFPEELTVDQDAYMIARNGKHSGISVRKMEDDRLLVSFSYWITNMYRTGETEYRYVSYVLPKEWENEFNDYQMSCDHESKSIHCFVNNEYKGSISYRDFTKENYTNAFIWFGCGSMIVESLYQSIGSFEFELVFLFNENVDINDMYYLKTNYSSWTNSLFDELPIFNELTPHRENIMFASDFKYDTKYKIWNYAFNGVFPQLYIENNIYF